MEWDYDVLNKIEFIKWLLVNFDDRNVQYIYHWIEFEN